MSQNVKLLDPTTGLPYRSGAAPDNVFYGTSTNPLSQRKLGSVTMAVGQVNSSVSPAAATQIVGARTGRHSVTLVNATGTQPVYITSTAVTTGVTTGFYLAPTAAPITLNTAAAIFATSPTAAQAVSFSELY